MRETNHPTFDTRLMGPPGAVVVSGAPLPLSPRQPRPVRRVEVVDGGCAGVRVVSCRVVRSTGDDGGSQGGARPGADPRKLNRSAGVDRGGSARS